MVSPVCQVNSASLGGWTATTNGIAVALGETVTVRLADSAGVKFWSLKVFGIDDLVVFDDSNVSIDLPTKTATFTSPSTPTSGWSILFQSTVGVSALGKDASFADRVEYTTTFKVFFPTLSGLSVVCRNETLEGSLTEGWAVQLNTVVRGVGNTSTGVAGGDLSGNFPAPTVAKLKGTAITTAGGSLTPGWVLRVTAGAIADWGPLDLSNSNALTGSLPLSKLAAGTQYQVITAGVSGVWAAGTVHLDQAAALSGVGADNQIAFASSGHFAWSSSLTWDGSVFAAPSAKFSGLAPGGVVTAASDGTLAAGQSLTLTGALHVGSARIDNLNAAGLVLTDASGNLSPSGVTLSGVSSGTGLLQVTGGVVSVAPGGANAMQVLLLADRTALANFDTATLPAARRGWMAVTGTAAGAPLERWSLVPDDTVSDTGTRVAAKTGVGTTGNWVLETN